MAADLIQSPLLGLCEKGKSLGLRQRLWHERLSEIEPFLASNNVVYSPADPLGGFERSLVSVIVLHGQSSFCFFVVGLPFGLKKGRKHCQVRLSEFCSKKQRVKKFSGKKGEPKSLYFQIPLTIFNS